MFTIGDVPREPLADFLFSPNIFEVAENHGLLAPGGVLHFARAFGLPRSHSVYCTRRVWRVQSLVAPSLKLSPDTDMFGSDYPFSVPVEGAPLTAEDLMRIQRDHYEGTAYDLTQGPGAGPFGDPQRFDPSTNENGLTPAELVDGAFERAISMFRTSYSIVAQARSGPNPLLAPLVWFCSYAPHSSSYVPFYVNQNRLPKAYTRGSLFKYDSTTAFWNFLAAGNYASRFYKFAMQDVFELQRELQDASARGVQEIEMRLSDMSSLDREQISFALDDFSDKIADATVSAWAQLLPKLITKYHDGYRAESLSDPTISMHKVTQRVMALSSH